MDGATRQARQAQTPDGCLLRRFPDVASSANDRGGSWVFVDRGQPRFGQSDVYEESRKNIFCGACNFDGRIICYRKRVVAI